MAEARGGRVTITLGRSGQVVKRATQLSGVSNADSVAAAGAKRSVRDRLGSNADSSVSHRSELNNKRQRSDISSPSLSANGSNGNVRIGRDDLRYKLMQKNAFRRVQSDDDQNRGDLREKLSKAVRPPAPIVDSRQRLPEPKDTGFLGRIPPTRSADDLPRMDSVRSSYSTWTLDHLRRRSPDRVVGMGASRDHSPPRNMEEQHRRPLNRTHDSRSVPYMSKEVFDTSGPMSTTPFMAKPAVPPIPAKPVPPPLGQLPPPLTSLAQKSSYMGDEQQQTVDGLLQSLGLGKYVILFKAEEVDMTALKQMGEHDLKELGIPMGPRKKDSPCSCTSI